MFQRYEIDKFDIDWFLKTHWSPFPSKKLRRCKHITVLICNIDAVPNAQLLLTVKKQINVENVPGPLGKHYIYIIALKTASKISVVNTQSALSHALKHDDVLPSLPSV